MPSADTIGPNNIPCPQCAGKGRLQEGMGSRECCGLCRGTATIPNPVSSNLNESLQPDNGNPNRLTS